MTAVVTWIMAIWLLIYFFILGVAAEVCAPRPGLLVWKHGIYCVDAATKWQGRHETWLGTITSASKSEPQP